MKMVMKGLVGSDAVMPVVSLAHHLVVVTIAASAISVTAVGQQRTQEQSDGSYGLISMALQGFSGYQAQAGACVAIDGDFAVIGAPDATANNRGAAFGCSGTAMPDPWGATVDFQELVSTPGGSRFGTAVAVNGSMVAISAPGTSEGIVHIFMQDEWGDWHAIDEISNPMGPSSGQFGASLALGDVLVIGDPGANNGDGVVHIFDVVGGAASLIATLDGPIHVEPGGNFGNDVALLGTTLAIGAPGPLGGAGAVGGRVSIYDINLGKGSPVQLDVVIEGGSHELSQFGFSVALSESGATRALAAGMPGMDLMPGDHGTVEVYRDSGDGQWLLEASLAPDATSNMDGFGMAVGMGSDLLAVGAPYTTSTAPANGTGIIYRFSPTSNTWLYETTIHPVGATGGDQFGAAVAVSPGKVVFGAPGLASIVGQNTGQALLYEEPDDGEWQNDPRSTLPIVLDRSFFGDEEPSPQFASEIALSGQVALVGNPAAGQIHIFRREGGAGASWQNMYHQVLPPDTSDPPYRFGEHIVMSGDIAVVAAPYADIGGEVYVYQDASGMGMDWVLVQIMQPADGESSALGAGIAMKEVDGQLWLAVGEPGNIFDTQNSGEVHLYTWNAGSGQFTLNTTLTNPGYVDGESSSFGNTIALAESSTSSLLVAASDIGSYPAGRVDIFAETIGAGFMSQQTLLPEVSYYEFFGAAVSFDDEVLAIASSTSDFRGNISAYRRSVPLRDDPTGWTDYTFTYNLGSDAGGSNGGIFDGFATQVEVVTSPRRILASAPGVDYMEINAGCVYSFAPSADQPGQWNLDAMMTSASAVPGDAAGPFAVGPDTVLVGCPGSDDAVATPRRILDFAFGETVSWLWQGGGNMSQSSLWSGDTNGANGRFSLLLAEDYAMNFDIQEWAGSLEIAFNDIMFELLGYADREITGDLLVSSPAAEDMAIVDLRDGHLLIGNDVVLGPALGAQNRYDLIGGLHFHAASITIGNRLEMSQGSSLLMELMPPSSRDDGDPPTEPSPTIVADQVVLRGTLFAEVRPEGDIFLEGDQFELIASTSDPIQGGFDAIVLPGLPNGLAFELVDVPGFRGPSGSTLTATVVSLAGLLDFGDPNSTTVTGDPTGVEVVDLTGDGAEEICVTLAGSPGSLVIFENDGAGGVAQQIIIPTGDEPVDISSGDFDGDGNNDLAVANNLSQDISIYYNDDNDPSNGFTTIEDLNVDGPPTCLAGINANYDLYDDLVVGLEDIDGDGNGYWAIYLGVTPLRNLPGGMSGGGGIAPSGTPLGADPSEEEDQKDYLFGGRKSDGKTSIVKGSAALRGVTLTITEHTTGADPGGITTGDVNGDGNGDICVTSTTNGTVAILLQDAGSPGDFLPAIFVPVGGGPTRITSVDFDNDGNIDLAAIVQEMNPSSGLVEPVVRVLQGNGNLSFTSLETAWDEGVVLVDSGDVSGDGASELVTIGGGASFRGGGDSPLLSLRNVTTPTCPGDFDGTGDVGIDDLLILLGEFADCTSGCQSDIDNDSDVDIDDMLTLIGAWGVCPR